MPGARFCDACGTPVSDGEAAPAATAVRKVVTVLFADLAGSTSMEEGMDAESVRSVIDRFYAAMRGEVERHGGRVVKFTGDGVMAAFGVPDVHEDDAARAIDAALAMRGECTSLAEDLSLDLSLKIGINTGEVVVSESDDDIVGDAVNVAARFEGAAAAGEIFVGEETWRLTRGGARYEPIEPLTLKGKSEPVPAYRLLAVDERTADSAAAPFVGRDEELRRLLAVFDDAVAANAARFVSVIGSPGLGKTRLARELASALGDAARVRETRCDPAGSATFAPIAEALRAAVGIADTDAEADVVAKLIARFPESDEDRERIARRAAAILGVGAAGTTEETFWALRRLIEQAAMEQPVVLVLDDLHWAEPLLLDLVEHLAEWIRDAPVLIVGTGRPELRDVRPSLAEGGRAAAVIALEGLDRSATAQLALNLLGADELPSELLTKIPASTEGNPLFVRELVRMLVDDGVLMRGADGWHVTVDVDAIQVPPTIQSLLSARVERLRNDERTVVELASVIGKEFYRGALIDLAPEGVRELVDGCLESLRRKELVEPVGTYWIDQPVYRFHHALIRDAAYRRLLKESRAELHEHVAAWLEEKTADVLGEHDELLGYHLEQAHEYKRQLGRPDDALAARAGGFLGAAARRALDRDDLPAAAALSERALACLPADDDDRPELLLIQCEALLSMADVPRSTVALDTFRSVAQTPRLAAWATCFECQLGNITASGTFEESEERLAAAAEELTSLGDQAGAAKAHTVHAATLGNRGRFAESEAVLDLALTAARAANDRRRITATLGMAPHAALWGPNPVSRAGGRCLDIVRLLRITTGSPAVEVTSLRCQAVLEALRGRADAARGMLRSARRTLTELGLQRDLLETDQFSGIVELIERDWSAAVPYLRASYEGSRAFGLDALAAQSASMLARAHLNLGDEEEAEALLETSAALGGEDIKNAIDRLGVEAELLARRGRFDDARRSAERSVAIAEQTDATFDSGNAYRSLAEVLRSAGDAGSAKRAEDRALALFERKGATALLGSTDAERVEATVSERDPDQATLENDAVRVFRAMGKALEDRDWEGFASRLDEDAIFDDRRPLVSNPVRGREAIVDIGKSIADSGVMSAGLTVLATRGERLFLGSSLLRGRVLGSTAYETEVLAIVGINARGLIDNWIPLDAQDVAAALEALDDVYLADEGAPYGLESLLAAVRALNTNDWDALRSLCADDIVVVDHRPASLGELHGVDEYLQAVRQLKQLTPDLALHARVLHQVSTRCGLAELVGRGTADGAPVESAFLGLALLTPRLQRVEWFPLDQLEAAIARFRELDTHGPGHLQNKATTLSDQQNASFEARDWAAHESSVADDIVFIDRRVGLSLQAVGRDAYMEITRAVADVALRFTQSPVAIRGERLLLDCMVATGRGGPAALETEFLSLKEYDTSDRLVRMVNFDPSDFAAALAELDERFIAGEGRSYADLLAVHRRGADALTRHLWEDLRSVMTDDFEFFDHRAASLGHLDREGWIDSIRALVGLSADWHPVFTRFHEFGDDVYLVENQNVGTTTDAGQLEFPHLTVVQTRDGRWARMELFAPEAFDEAKARFAQLNARAPELENACAEAMRLWSRLYEAGDWTRMLQLHREDFIFEDRRRGLAVERLGADAHIEQLKVMVSMGAMTAEFSPVAIRGDRLVLGHWVFGGRGSRFETAALIINEIDEEGRHTAAAVFDPDEIEAAFAEIDERFTATEGNDVARLVRLAQAFIGSMTRRAWDEIPRFVADDVVLVDHRFVGLGELRGSDAWIAAMKAHLDLSREGRSDIAAFRAWGPTGGVVEIRDSGITQEGSVFEIAYHMLGILDGDRATRIEVFAVEDLKNALARFDELASDDSALTSNAAFEVTEGMYRAFERRDWGAVSACLAPDVVLDDRRAGVHHYRVGIDDVGEDLKSIAAIGVTTVDLRPIATRGDRLALVEIAVGTDPAISSFGMVVLGLFEVDGSARISGLLGYDHEQLDDAFAELDRRYLAAAGVAGDGWAHFARFSDAYNRRDWIRLREQFASEFVFDDHRPAGAGHVEGADAFIATMRALIDLISDARLRGLTVHRTAPSKVLVHVYVGGTNPEAGRVEFSFHAIGVVPGGLIQNLEFFPEEQFELALARYDEIESTARTLENRASRQGDAGSAALQRRDWDAARSLLADDLILDDRRRSVGSYGVGAEKWISNFRAQVDLGLDVILHQDVLAIRGERLALADVTISDPSGNVIHALTLLEIDEDGKTSRLVWFDPEDLDLAYVELEDRFASGEGSANVDFTRLGTHVLDALNRRDWSRFRSLLADDLVFVDHRPISLSESVGADQRVSELRSLLGLFGSYHWTAPAYHAIAGETAIIELAIRGETNDGASVEISYECVTQKAGERLTRMELFPVESLAAAHARFDELAEGHRDERENAAVTNTRRRLELLGAGRLEEFVELHAPSWIGEDRRPGLAAQLEGHEGAMIAARSLATISTQMQVVAIRGERLALIRTLYTPPGREGFEVEALTVEQVDDQGLATRGVAFSPDDVELARGELDRIHAEDEVTHQALENAATRVYAEGLDAFTSADWERMRGLLCDDLVSDDRRRSVASQGVGADAYINSFQAVHDLGFRRASSDVLATRGDRLGLTRWTLADAEGNEIVGLAITDLGADDRTQALVWFDVGDLDAAFEELDTRYAAGERPDAAGGVRLALLVAQAHNRRDWEAFRSLVADDCSVIDHRPMSLGEMQGPEWVDSVRLLSGMSSSYRFDIQCYYALANDRAAVRLRNSGTSTDGVDFEIVLLGVISQHRGRLVTLEFFPMEARAAALRRFGELERDGLTNVASRCSARIVQSVRSEDWDSLRELLSQDLRIEDRRSGAGSVGSGPEAWVNNMQAFGELGLRFVDQHSIAVRGGRLCLSRQRLADGDGNTIDSITLLETGPDDRAGRIVIFASDDLDAAFNELDERYRSGEGKAYADQIAFGTSVFRAMNERDWPRYRSLLHDDLVLVDHRPASLGEMVGGDAQVDAVRALTEVVPSIRFYVPAVHAMRAGACVVDVAGRGHTQDEDEIDLSFTAVYVFDNALSRIELFPSGDADAALGRFAEITESSAPGLANDCTRLMDKVLGAAVDRRWSDVAAGFAEDIVGVDRRIGLRGSSTGRDENVETLKVIAELGATSVDVSAIATRGERLALLTLVIRGEDEGLGASEVELIGVYELNDRGQLKRATTFEPSDLDAAFDELDFRFLASDEVTELDRLGAEHLRAYNDRDWQRLAELYSDDFSFKDHHDLGRPNLDASEQLRSMQALVALVPDLRGRIVQIHREYESLVLAEQEFAGSDTHGSSVEYESLVLMRARGGRICSLELYPATELDRALARFDELTARI